MGGRWVVHFLRFFLRSRAGGCVPGLQTLECRGRSLRPAMVSTSFISWCMPDMKIHEVQALGARHISRGNLRARHIQSHT